jgi:hypothetical protein
MEPDNPTPSPTENAKGYIGRDVSGRVAIGENITQFFFGSVKQQHTQRNQRTMLQMVRNVWITSVLEQSLHGAVMMALGLEERAEAVEHLRER